ncbi:uncharacterized protein [Bemisia tabaci]|uniref:uncharacterized protein n=1 Tax=Bemisia tabaci TaxID=7038 RepID=UPI003B28681E
MLPIPTKLFISLISEPVINNADLQEELTICKNNSVALPELIEVFKKTCHLRILLFGKGPKDIAKYITTYPALSKPDGHYLIEKDFDIVYPGKRNNFLTNWPEFGRKIFDHVFSIVARGDNKSLKINCSSLNIDLNIDDDEKKILNALFLLPLLLPSLTVQKKWKPSRIEVSEAFYLSVETIEEAQEKLAERTKRLQKHGLPELPTPVAVGHKYYVVVADHFWECDSALKAIDSCCKLLMLLKVLPQDCGYPFLFLKFFLYKIDVESHVGYPALSTLKNDLRM